MISTVDTLMLQRVHLFRTQMLAGGQFREAAFHPFEAYGRSDYEVWKRISISVAKSFL